MAKAIYKIDRPLLGELLVWMDDSDAAYRNKLGGAPGYTKETDGKRIPKSMHNSPYNSFQRFIVQGKNGKTYYVYDADHSAVRG